MNRMANKHVYKRSLRKCKLTPQLDPTTRPREELKLKKPENKEGRREKDKGKEKKSLLGELPVS